MNPDLFKMMIEKQQEWRDQFMKNKHSKRIIQTITNRKYKSKGNKNMEQIHQDLVELGLLEEITLTQTESGNLCFESLYGK